MLSTKEGKILESLYSFAESKAKLLTNKKIKLGIRMRPKYNENGQIYIATITIRKNDILIKIDKRAFSKFSITNLKQIINHELAHIVGLENPMLETRYDSRGKPYKVYQDSHGKQFKTTAKKLKVGNSFSRSNLNKLKKLK